MNRSDGKKAFTLIELLVVLAIVAVLAAVLLPSLRRAREAGRTVVCKSLMRNYTLIHYAYFYETNQFIPLSINDPVMRPWSTFDEFRNRVGLHPLDQEYRDRRIGNIQEYKPAYPKKNICPSARYALANPEEDLYALERSYGLNAHIYFAGDYVRDRMYKQSARILCMADALDWWFNYWQCDVYAQSGEVWLGFDTYGTAAYRHPDQTANVSFWDGSVKRMNAFQLKENMYEWMMLEERRRQQ